MSYGIGLHFKHINSEADILDLMYNIQQEYNNNEQAVQEILEDNKFWLTDRYYNCRKLELTDGKFVRSPLFNYFMQNIFTFRLYYWKDYNLVALCYGSNPLPNHLDKYFDGYIYFQNSCDQDYDYSEWKVLGDLATPFIEKAKKMSSRELYLNVHSQESDNNEDFGCRHKRDYNEKTFVYKCVEEALDIKNTLWLNKTNKFKFFEFTKAFNYDNYDIENQIINFLEKIYKERHNE